MICFLSQNQFIYIIDLTERIKPINITLKSVSPLKGLSRKRNLDLQHSIHLNLHFLLTRVGKFTNICLLCALHIWKLGKITLVGFGLFLEELLKKKSNITRQTRFGCIIGLATRYIFLYSAYLFFSPWISFLLFI